LIIIAIGCVRSKRIASLLRCYGLSRAFGMIAHLIKLSAAYAS